MSVLVILIPPRARLATRGASPMPEAAGELDWVLSADGLTVGSQGRSAPALLPKADTVVAVLAPADVAWHRLRLPKAPSGRLRAALAGVLEDTLLDEPEAVHFAVQPMATAGSQAWVAVMHKPFLAAAIARIESSGRTVDRVLPGAWPPALGAEDDPPPPMQGHFALDAGAAQEGEAVLTLVCSDAEGVRCLRLAGSLSRALVPQTAAPGEALWTASPAAAEAAEAWLGAPVALLGDAERALQAVRSPWNLRQFDLAARHRGLRALRESARRFLSPQWRPVRIGLVALLLVNLVGLNAVAWQQERRIAERRQAMDALLRETFPQLRVVLDAPLQMQRETERLRTAAGRAGETDLEPLLGAAAAAWPEAQGPAQALRYETGRLTVTAPGWNPDEQRRFGERLRPLGYTAEAADGRVVVRRSN